MAGRGADALRSIYAYLSKFNRKMLHVIKNRKAFIPMMNAYRGIWATYLTLTYRPCT